MSKKKYGKEFKRKILKEHEDGASFYSRLIQERHGWIQRLTRRFRPLILIFKKGFVSCLY